MKNLIVRTITGLVFVALVVASLFLPSYCFFALFLTFALIGTWECLKLAEKTGASPQLILPLLLSATLFSALHLSGCLRDSVHFAESQPSTVIYVFMVVVLLAFLVPIVELFRKKEHPLHNVAGSLFPALWVAVPLGVVAFWLTFFKAPYMILALFIIIWAFDTFAYCMGSLFGKHPLFKRISPKKTWEGTLISLVLTLAGSTLFYYIPVWQNGVGASFGNNGVLTNPLHWIGFAFVIVVTASLGDLVESMFKRDAQVKDSGNILPGHGGILDRLDSLFFAAPAAFVYWVALYALDFFLR